MNNSLTTFLLINSILIIGLITIQNESKDNNNAQSSNTTSTSPLELLTWGTVLLELILLLIKLKITEI
jgi:preprotein translocase subunit SecG|tara:strand:- start:66 stop:269 length:204 start_codon:yes stop_codon:yes gene_type:complete